MYQTGHAGQLYSFFEWLLSQKLGKGGRRRRGTKHNSSLGTYWKLYRLVYQRATGTQGPSRIPPPPLDYFIRGGLLVLLG